MPEHHPTTHPPPLEAVDGRGDAIEVALDRRRGILVAGLEVRHQAAEVLLDVLLKAQVRLRPALAHREEIGRLALGLLLLGPDGEQQQRGQGPLVRRVALVPFEEAERDEEGRDAHLLLGEARLGRDLLHHPLELVGEQERLEHPRVPDRAALCEVEPGIDAQAPGVLVAVEVLARGARRQAELVAHAVAQPALEALEGSGVVLARRIDRLDARQVVRVRDPRPVQQGAELGRPLLQRNLVGLGQRGDAEGGLVRRQPPVRILQ